MRIAFISYEYPPDTAVGGIATYVYQAVRVLQQRGHDVEVFTASRERHTDAVEEGIHVHRIFTAVRTDFPDLIAPVFAERHRQVRFDVLEGPDYRAEASRAVRLVPEIPLVVRLHTPLFLVDRIRDAQLSEAERRRARRRAVRRGVKPSWNPFNPQYSVERLHILEADEIVGISRSITEILRKLWHLPSDRICQIPNPYVPSQALLDIPVETCTQTVTFLGRLELRKGVLDLAKAIPLVLRRYPSAKFRFVGRPVSSPRPDMDMAAYLAAQLRFYRHAVEFAGPVTMDHLAETFVRTDLCVFPSLWENFPYVCMEAMAAGRGVVGSAAGGMHEMLDGGQAGLIIPPNRPDKIASALVRLLKAPELRKRFGSAARARVLAVYNAELIGAQMEQSYRRAIERRTALGSR